MDDILTIPGCENALLGTIGDKAVYSLAKIWEGLMEDDGMEFEEAQEWCSYNIEGAYMGDRSPLFVEPIRDER